MGDLSDFDKMEPLKGLVLYVEVFLQGSDDSLTWVERAKALGADVSTKLVKRVTHLVFKEGNTSSYRKAVARNIPIVRPSWIFNCEASAALLPTADYTPAEPLTNIKVKRAREPDQLSPLEKRLKVADAREPHFAVLEVKPLNKFLVFVSEFDVTHKRYCSRLPNVELTWNLRAAKCILVSTMKSCLEVAYARAKGLPVVNNEWLRMSASAGKVADLAAYKFPEVAVDPVLFKRYTFAFCSRVHHRGEIQEIIECLGGSVTDNLRSADKIITDSYQQTHKLGVGLYVPLIRSKWVVEAVMLNKLTS
jgi:hypothetical protein